MGVVSVLLVAATFVPYGIQAANPPEGRTFAWMFQRLPDEASYLMWMDQHAAGHLAVRNRMALDAEGTLPPNPVWLVLGRIQAWTGLPGIVVYHAGRAMLALAYLWVLAALCLCALPTHRQALAAFLMAATGSGLGWLASLGLPVRSADWITELWSFPSLFHYPHFAASLALAAGGLLLLWRARSPGEGHRPGRDAWWNAAGSALCWALLVWVHPYTAGTLYAALFLSLLLDRLGSRPLVDARPGAVVLGAGALSIVAMAAYMSTSPAMQSWASQNRLPSPPPVAYMLGLGVVGALAAWGIVARFARRDWPPTWRFLAAWIVAAAAMAYASPLIPFERRCVEGVHFALAMFAASAVGPLVDRLGRRGAAAAMAGLVVAVAPTNVVMLVVESANPRASAQIRDDWPELFDTVRALPGERTVCTDGRTGMFLAAFGAAAVNAGHDQLTPDLPARLGEFDAFLRTPAPWAERAAWMARAGCRWLVLTPTSLAARAPDEFPDALVAARGRTWVVIGPVDGAPRAGSEVATPLEIDTGPPGTGAPGD